MYARLFILPLGFVSIQTWFLAFLSDSLAVYFISLFFHGKKVFVWLLSLLFLSATFVFFSYPTTALNEPLIFSVLLLFSILFFLPVLWHKKKKVKPFVSQKKEKKEEEKAIVRVSPKNAKNMPIGSGVKEVQLDYAFKMLKLLSAKAVSELDKIKLQTIQTALSSYQNKPSLTVEENNLLNDHLSSILKLLSTYGA